MFLCLHQIFVRFFAHAFFLGGGYMGSKQKQLPNKLRGFEQSSKHLPYLVGKYGLSYLRSIWRVDKFKNNRWWIETILSQNMLDAINLHPRSLTRISKNNGLQWKGGVVSFISSNTANIAPEKWCLGKDPFLLRFGLFSERTLSFREGTWRIIPFRKWLIALISKSSNWGCSPSNNF